MDAKVKGAVVEQESATIIQRNLFQRINEVMADKDAGYIQKLKSVSTGGGSYKAITHDDVTAVIRGPMTKAGIMMFPSLISDVMLPKEEGVKQNRYECLYEFTFVNVDDPADRITFRVPAHAMDNADKAPGKGLSYATKYAVLKLFMIETGEDEESRVDDYTIEDLVAIIHGATSPEDLAEKFAKSYERLSNHDKLGQKALVVANRSMKEQLTGKKVFDPASAERKPVAATATEEVKKAAPVKPAPLPEKVEAEAAVPVEPQAEQPPEQEERPVQTEAVGILSEGEVAHLTGKAKAANIDLAVLCKQFGVTELRNAGGKFAEIKKYIVAVH